jgi:ribosomal-protein-alanine N-acetyltransferase
MKLMNFPPRIFFTERLILRQPVIEDASAIYEVYAQDKEVTKYLTWKVHSSVKETQEFLKRCNRVWREGMSFPWTILRKSDNQVMGMIEVSFEETGAILGFVLGQNFWGKEYMPEAIKTIISWCLAQNNLYRVWAFCDCENKASARAMEKAGMQKEGLLKRWLVLPQLGDRPRDCIAYSIIKE